MEPKEFNTFGCVAHEPTAMIFNAIIYDLVSDRNEMRFKRLTKQDIRIARKRKNYKNILGTSRSRRANERAKKTEREHEKENRMRCQPLDTHMINEFQ